MIKKAYIQPDTETIELLSQQSVLSSSLISGGGLDGLDGFGGEDTGGEKDPASRLFEEFDSSLDNLLWTNDD